MEKYDYAIKFDFMDKHDLHELLAPLMEAQIMNNFMIKVGLLKYDVDDPCMLKLYENQDDIYSQIRELIEICPTVKPYYLESFDKVLFEYRLNLLLGLQNICVSKS